MTADLRHPQEQQALVSLLQSKPFQLMLETFHTLYSEATSFAELQGRNFLITSITEPRIDRLYQTAKRRLGMGEDIPLYAAMDYGRGTKVLGTDGDCAIVLDSTCIEHYTDQQLLAVLGRAICHIQYDHVKYLNIGNLTDHILRRIPFVGSAAVQAAKALLLSWRKYAECTADRGAAVAANGIEPVEENLLYGMGVFHPEESTNLWKIKSPSSGTKLPDQEMALAGKFVFQMLMNDIPVPFGVLRIEELRRWRESAACRRDFPQIHYGYMPDGAMTHRSDGQVLYHEALRTMREDREQWMELLHSAAKLGQPDAQAFLGRCYLLGNENLPKNLSLGMEWMREAALAGNRDGLYGLGLCFFHGQPPMIQPDEKAAVRLMRAAASRGQEKATQWLKENPHKQGLLHPVAAERLLEWFTRNYIDGPCTVHRNDNSPALRHIQDCLWIPIDELVYASEDAGGCTIAFCQTGVYFYGGKGLPRYVSWLDLSKGEMDGSEEDELLYWNGMEICRYVPHSRERQMAMLLIQLKSQFDRQKERNHGTG